MDKCFLFHCTRNVDKVSWYQCFVSSHLSLVHSVHRITVRSDYLGEEGPISHILYEGRGTDKSLALSRKQQAMGLKKYIFSAYPPLSSTHLRLCCSNFFNQPKKNSFGCAANRKRGKRKIQRLISTPT
jgi:hypothetical protein